MYTWELEEFIRSRNYYLGGDDLIKAISMEESPQITRVKHATIDGQEKYIITTKDCFSNGENKIEFCSMPYPEAEAKGLVKRMGTH